MMLIAAKYLVLLLAGVLLVACGPTTIPRPSAPATGPGSPVSTPAGSAGSHLAVGAPVPDFRATDLEGRPLSLSALRGQPVWINFWATWCPPCKTEMPAMEQKYQQYHDQGLQIIGIDLQESPAVVRAWTTGKFSWRFVIDADGALANLFALEGVPTHIFIDRSGVVQSIHIGALSAAQMDAGLAQIVPPQ